MLSFLTQNGFLYERIQVRMGIYVNPGKRMFSDAVHDDIYIDKTGLIAHINRRIRKTSRYLCVSRPRRFGKSMAADMLTAYYSKGCDSADLFSGLEIEKESSYKDHLNKYNVLRIDVQQFITSRKEIEIFIENIRSAVIDELMEEFPDCKDIDKNISLQMAFNKIFSSTGEGFIFIIDEWDCVFRFAQNNSEIQIEYLDFLRGLFKGAIYADLVYMTGIFPIKKYGEHSALNIFEEYSMTNSWELSTYFGFTENEVKEECEKRNIDFNKMSKWYDGYILEDENSYKHIYNPRSAVCALMRNRFESYWTGTETYEALKIYIEKDFEGLKAAVVEMLGGGRCQVNTRSFQNDMTSLKSKDDVISLLIHLGYLAYDSKTKEAFIPNLEISREFAAVTQSPEWGNLFESIRRSDELLKRTWAMDEKAVAAGIALSRQDISSIINYNDENALSFAVYAAYSSALAYYMKPIREFPSGRGFADLVYLPRRGENKPAMIIELKWNKNTKGAINQIKTKQYADWIKEYTGDILLIGISYDKKTDTHNCLIEKEKIKITRRNR